MTYSSFLFVLPIFSVRLTNPGAIVHYDVNYNMQKDVEEGWVLRGLTLGIKQIKDINTSGCFQLPMKLLEATFSCASGTLYFIIPF